MPLPLSGLFLLHSLSLSSKISMNNAGFEVVAGSAESRAQLKHLMGCFCILIDSGVDLFSATWPFSGAVLQCERSCRPDHLMEGMWDCL